MDWWEPSTKASYLRKASCIIEQYGSYKIERLGIALFERIEGRDFTAITGLPLMAVSAMLRDAGFDVP